jgi:hypothetical protein
LANDKGEGSVKTIFWIVSILFLAAAPAFAQGGTLVIQDDNKEPCARFKLRVLIPAGTDEKMVSRTTDQSFDPGMVVNPCGTNDLQIAAMNPLCIDRSTLDFFFKDAQKHKSDSIKTAPPVAPRRSPRLTP